MRILLFAGLKMAPLFSKKSSLFQIMARRKKITFFYRADMELFSLGIFSSGKLGTIYRANSPLYFHLGYFYRANSPLFPEIFL